MSLCFPKAARLTRSSEFARLKRDGAAFHGKYLILSVLEDLPEQGFGRVYHLPTSGWCRDSQFSPATAQGDCTPCATANTVGHLARVYRAASRRACFVSAVADGVVAIGPKEWDCD